MSTPPPSHQHPVEVARQRSAAGLGWVRERLGRAGLVRPSRGKLVAGVLAGLASRLGLSPWLVRGAFLLSMFLPGPQLLLYVALWITMPREP